MLNAKTLDSSRIAQDLQIRKVQVESVVQLLDEGNTIPFITRYRKERTGGLNEEVIRQIQLRVKMQRQLADRKLTILKSIENQGKLTDELRKAIQGADTAKRLEDLYLPHKPKKRSLATAAKEKGLEPLALAIWNRDPAAANLEQILPDLVNPDRQLASVEDVKAGLIHILAEMVSETADVRAAVRFGIWETGQLVSAKNEKVPPHKGGIFKNYFSFSEPVRKIPPHRILALNRGEREGILRIKIDWNKELVQEKALKGLADFCMKQAQAGDLPQPTFVPAPPAPAPVPAIEAAPAPESAPAVEPAPTAASAPAPATPLEATTTPDPELNIPVASEPVASEPPAPEPSAPAPAIEISAAALSPEPEASPELPPAAAPRTAAPTSVSAEAATEPADAGAPTSAPAPVPDGGALPPLVVPNEGELLSAGSEYRTPHVAFMKQVFEDAVARLIAPSIEREIRRELMDEAEMHAISVFAHNLRNLLLQRPLHQRRVLAVDPGFRSGCKLIALDEYGNVLEHTTIYPHPPKEKPSPKKEKPAETPAPGAAAAPAPESAAPANSAPPQGETPAPDQPSAPEASAPAATEVAPATPPAPDVPAPVEATPAPPTPAPPAPESAASGEASAAPAEAPPAPTIDLRAEAKAVVDRLVQTHKLDLVAIGNGTACRETEEFFAEAINEKLPQLSYVIVNEAGASVYSASNIGREEFPDFDATVRGTISIGRRLQDPLAELVKIDPPHLGVGLYQHDINPKHLKDTLEGVVESSVNQVGVDVNTASIPLLRYIAGLNQLVAREIVDHRKTHGPFRTREQLQYVNGMGPTRFVQAAGFLKVHDGDNPLDVTWIHPESYGITTQLIGQLGYGPDVIRDPARKDEFHAKLKALSPAELAAQLQTGEPTVRDIIDALLRPGLDPREDLPLPVFRKGILKLEDLHEGMELRGTVLNVVDFGAFVDVGLKDSGLVHISQLANRYVKNPYDVVAVGDVVTVWVLKVDLEQRYVSLTMIRPGSERRHERGRPERGRPERERTDRPERGRPERAAQPQGAPAGAPSDRPQREHRPGGPPRGDRRDDRGRPPRQGAPGRGGPPQRHGGRPPYHGGRPPAGADAPGAPAGQGSGGDRPRQPDRPPPRPRRDMPRPKLSKAALEGKEALRTFGELSAFFAAKTQPDPRENRGAPRAEEKPSADQPAPTSEQPPSGESAPPAPVAEPSPASAPPPVEPPPVVPPQSESATPTSEAQPAAPEVAAEPAPEPAVSGEPVPPG